MKKENKTKEVIEYDKSYLVPVCPYCNHTKIVDIYTGSEGLFSSKSFSHYKCSKCSREFNSKKYLWVVPREFVQKVVQAGLSKELSSSEVIKEFKKINIYLSNYKK